MSTVTITVAGTTYQITDGSFFLDDTIDERTTLRMAIREDTGLIHFQKLQKITVTDSLLGLLFAGFVHTPTEKLLYPTTTVLHTIDVNDVHWIADKRTIQKLYSGYAGNIICNILTDVLAAEGITASYAIRTDTTQADFNAGTLSNTIGSTYGDGDLELTLAGTVQAFNDAAIAPTGSVAICLKGTAVSGITNAYVYRQIWSGSQAIASGDQLSYDVWIQNDSPQIMAGVDFICTDGTTFRDSPLAGTDAQGIGPHPNNDLSGLANLNTWYSRGFGVSGSLIGKTIASVSVALEGDNAGTYTAYFRNIIWSNGGTTKAHFHDAVQSNLQSNIVLFSNGYSNVSVFTVTAYAPLSQYTAAGYQHSISGAGIVKSSYVSWTTSLANDASVLIETSIDGGAEYQPATLHGSVFGLTPGLNASGNSVWFRVTINYGINPTILNSVTGITLVVSPSYQATKTDVKTITSSNASFSTGTFSNAVALSGNGIGLNGSTNMFDTGLGSVTLYGNGGPFFHLVNKKAELDCTSNSETRARLDTAGNTWANFTAEVDILAHSNVFCGLVYRTTNWQNNDASWAYTIEMDTGALRIMRGNNSSSGTPPAATTVASASLSLNDLSWHRLKIVISGSNHKVYVDNILYINATDATYSAAGYLAIRNRNVPTSTYSAQFDNFGVCAALTGTWTSASINLATTANYGTSTLIWDTTGIPDSTTSISVQTSINAGSTYQAITNGGSISGLTVGQAMAGVSVLLQVTLTAASATLQPTMHGITLFTQGQYSASGTRISPVLSLNGVGRAGSTLVNWTANTPTGTSLVVATSPDASVWTTIANGATIAGITTQATAILDTFASNTSANYTSTFYGGGGAVATWTWDTTNSKLTASGGTNPALLYNTTTIKDGYNEADMTAANGSGPGIRWVDSNNFYYVRVNDSLNGNNLALFKKAAGTVTQIGSTVGIVFPTGTPHRFRLDIQGTSLVASMDGATVISATDSAVAGPGQYFLRGGSSGTFPNVRFQGYGDSLAGKNEYTRCTLTSTDPTVTPQVLDITLSVHSPDITNGSLISTFDYRNNYCSAGFDELAHLSGDIWWYIDKNYKFYFSQRTAVPSPWIVYSGNQGTSLQGQMVGDVLLSSLQSTNEGDLYRNRQIITGCISTIALNQSFIGNGNASTFTLDYPLQGVPAISLNGVTKTVGVKGTTGSDYYYALNDPVIAQDVGGVTLTILDMLLVAGSGLYVTNVTVDNTAEQTRIAALDGTTGIVENVVDVSGQNMLLADATIMANGLLSKYASTGRTLTFQTYRSGLAPGQYGTFYIAEKGFSDAGMLILDVQTNLETLATGTQALYTVYASEGPNVGSWQKMLATALGG